MPQGDEIDSTAAAVNQKCAGEVLKVVKVVKVVKVTPGEPRATASIAN